MLVLMKPGATDAELNAVLEQAQQSGARADVVRGAHRTSIGLTGKFDLKPAELVAMPGVAEVVPKTKPYKLASRECQPEGTIIDLGNGATVGGSELVTFASLDLQLESGSARDQQFDFAASLASEGVGHLRLQAFSPTASPTNFLQQGKAVLDFASALRHHSGLKIVVEAIDEASLELADRDADIIEIGSRNMQNFALLKHVGRASKPILLKRGMSSTLEEFLLAAEYLLSEGTRRVILCERGVRTFAEPDRSTLDVSVVPLVRKLSHLPIVADPSHSAGSIEELIAVSRAAVAAGCDGLILSLAISTATTRRSEPSLHLDEFRALMKQLRQVAAVLSRTVPQASNLGSLVNPS